MSDSSPQRPAGDRRSSRAAERCAASFPDRGGPAALFAGRPYDRARHLPRLIALWPAEVDDTTPSGTLRIIRRLQRALRAERARCRAGHWSYDLNRHAELVHAYRAELRRFRETAAKGRVEKAGPQAAARRGRAAASRLASGAIVS